MKFDVYWLLNVIGSALVLGVCLGAYLYLTKRILLIESPPKQRSLLIFGLIVVATLTGASHNIQLAAMLYPAILSAWFVGHWARQSVESDRFERFAARVSSNPPLPPDSRGEPSRHRLTILAPTQEEAARCPVCGSQAMSAKTRSNTGPAKIHPCDSCGAPVSPSWSFALVLIAIAASGFVGAALLPDYSIACLLAASIGVFTLMFRYSARVPLVRRD